ncbi:hypothetical protein QBC40DRAFT_292229 [Triangularia verruculosa]|uniref:Uncharacterized protein n=1 Tax=Triangularia verruculosa TaxID=2587418 RepID=A0AAN7B079_9PEZI|nr:hypothetical protein QBC40DRAFT_292229 [Triangularia verruculosa]
MAIIDPVWLAIARRHPQNRQIFNNQATALAGNHGSNQNLDNNANQLGLVDPALADEVPRDSPASFVPFRPPPFLAIGEDHRYQGFDPMLAGPEDDGAFEEHLYRALEAALAVPEPGDDQDFDQTAQNTSVTQSHHVPGANLQLNPAFGNDISQNPPVGNGFDQNLPPGNMVPASAPMVNNLPANFHVNPAVLAASLAPVSNFHQPLNPTFDFNAPLNVPAAPIGPPANGQFNAQLLAPAAGPAAAAGPAVAAGPAAVAALAVLIPVQNDQVSLPRELLKDFKVDRYGSFGDRWNDVVAHVKESKSIMTGLTAVPLLVRLAAKPVPELESRKRQKKENDRRAPILRKSPKTQEEKN